MKSIITAALVALLCAPAPAVAKETLDLSAPLPVDERLAVRETLPNGMQLWIRRHANPAAKVSMMLHVGAGSLNETDDQRGLAHYIEHMAFNGSTNFPPDTVIKKFESVGVQFGSGINAFTSFDLVGYMLNLSDAEAATVKLGLLFFSDVAQGLSFTPEEIDKERGVILEELRSRDDPSQRLLKKLVNLLAPGSLLSQRLPGGIQTVITAAKRPQFQRYYQSWYRPELSTLLIVGDIDPEKTAVTVREMFAGWKTVVTAAPAPVSGIEPIDTLRSAVFTDPDVTTASAGTSQVLAPRMRKTVGDVRAGLVEQLAAHIGQERLTRRKQAGNAVYQAATISVTPFLGGYRIAGTDVESETQHWAEAQRALFEEMRRLHLHGVLEDELARAKTTFLTGAEQAVDSAGSSPSGQILQRWIRGIGQGRTPMSQTQRLALMQRVLPTITAQEVHTRFKEIFPLDRGVLAINLPEKAGVTVDEAALIKMAKDVAQQDLAPPKAEKAVATLLEKAPTPGTVVSESKNEALDTTKWVLSNGAVVLVRPMPDTKVVSVQAHLYGGTMDETAANRGITALVGLAMGSERAATKRHGPSQISEYLNDKKVSVGLSRSDAGATVMIAGPPDDLGAGFELAHALLSEPKIDANSFEAAKSELVTMLEAADKQTGQQVMLRMRDKLSGGDPRLAMPSIAMVKSITLDAAQAWLDRIVSQAPMEIVFAGKITLERAKSLALTYIGSLPKRPDAWDALRKKRVITAAAGPVTQSLVVDTTSPAAIVVAGWTGVRRADYPALRAPLVQAGLMLLSRMNQEIREKRGLTYSAMARYSRSAFDGLDQLVLQFTADPEKAESTAKIAREVVHDFRDKGPSETEVTSTQNMIHTGLSGQKQLPQFWVSVLSQSTIEPAGLGGVAQYLEDVMKVDGEKIKAAVQRVIQPDRFMQVIGAPKPAPKKDEGSDGKAPEKAEDTKGEKKAEPAGAPIK